jgi:hypothetical protein
MGTRSTPPFSLPSSLVVTGFRWNHFLQRCPRRSARLDDVELVTEQRDNAVAGERKCPSPEEV